MSGYKPYISAWRQRPEYKDLIDYVKSGFSRRITRWSIRLAFIIGIFLVIWFWRKKQSVRS